MNIRHPVPDELGRILEIYAYAREFMKSTGNPTQWGDHHPSIETVRSDIINKDNYILEDENGIHAVFAFFIGEDESYAYIKDGDWKSDEPYGTIHRVASDGTIHDVLKEIVAFCLKQSKHLRIDTHADNKIMQHLAVKCGFQRSGIILTADDHTPRIAYELNT